MRRAQLQLLQRLLSQYTGHPAAHEEQARRLGLSLDQLHAIEWVGWTPGFTRGAAGQLAIGMADNGVQLPQLLRHPGDGAGVPLTAQRSSRPKAQSAWIRAENSSSGHNCGTLNSVLRDRRNGQLYALTAGHVLGSAPTTSIGDEVLLHLEGVDKGIAGQLHDWAPVFHSGDAITAIDAALVTIRNVQLRELHDMAYVPPAGIAYVDYDKAVALRTRDAALSAWPCGVVSTWLDLSDGGDVADYFLTDALGYQVHQGSLGGDSGAPVWDTQERLVAMHIGGGVGGDQGNATALPIGRLLDWSQSDLVVRSQGAPQPAAAPLRATPEPSAAAAPATPAPDRSADILARTMWGEARGEQDRLEAMAAVANVVMNRKRRQTFWGRTIIEVCRKPYQFSCWNPGDPNLAKLLRVTRDDQQFALALDVAEAILGARLPDNTAGATHYYSRRMPAPPRWARGHLPCAAIGNHLFFNDID